MDTSVHPLAMPGGGTGARRWSALVRLSLVVAIGIFLVPVGAGLLATLLPAFGYLPMAGGQAFGFGPWRALFGYPGFWSGLLLTVLTGIGATILSLALATGFCAAVHGRVRFRQAEAMLAPLLASPHAAMAIGLAFVLAPSGWIARLLSPWLTGSSVPLDITTVGDGWGIVLVIGLLVKEIPYLLLSLLAALNQIPVADHLRQGRSLGYGRGVVWIKIIFPQAYPQIRLPVYAVLVFSLSVVDMSIVLGPDNPSTLSVLAVRWFTSPDVSRYFPAAAAAVAQLAIALAGIGVWRLAETAAASLGRRWIERGGRGLRSEPGLKLATAIVLILFALGGGALVAMALWSFAWRWPFPNVLPHEWSMRPWIDLISELAWPTETTLVLASATMLIGLVLSIGWLESEMYFGRAAVRIERLIYLPLLVPQIAFLFGAQVLLVRLHLDGTFVGVIWVQLLYVLPYMLIALADPWRRLDPRYARAASSLGASPLRVLWTVKLPILLRPVLMACAVGFAVSVAQYLPTLFAGNGRIATLTTEAVTLASGADRRIVGVFTILQSALPLLVYAVALLGPALVYADPRALSGRT